MMLNEEQVRAKVIELLDGMNVSRMDMWMISGIFSGVLDPEMVERVMHQEVHQRPHQVVEFWMGLCDCAGHPN